MLAISIILPADDIHTLSVDKDFPTIWYDAYAYPHWKFGYGKRQGYGSSHKHMGGVDTPYAYGSSRKHIGAVSIGGFTYIQYPVT